MWIEGADCLFDNFTLYDGPGPSADMYDPLCGFEYFLFPPSSSNVMYMEFHSDRSVEEDRIRVIWHTQGNRSNIIVYSYIKGLSYRIKCNTGLYQMSVFVAT